MFKGKTGPPRDVLSSLELAASTLNLEETQIMCVQEWGGGVRQDKGLSSEQGSERYRGFMEVNKSLGKCNLTEKS